MATRLYRNDMAQATKDKIAAANVGKRHTQATKDKISRSMAKYWQRLPYKPTTTSGSTTDAIRQAATGTTTSSTTTTTISAFRTPPKPPSRPRP